MTSSVNRFEQMHSGNNRAAVEAAATSQFESERIKWLLQKLKLWRRAGEVREVWQRETGISTLKCAAFNQVFPTFPFVLGVHRLRNMPLPYQVQPTPDNYEIHMDQHCTEPSRFKNFARVPFVVAYESFYADAVSIAGNRRIALIVPRKGFAHGLVVHNDDTERFWDRGLCWVYKFAKTGRRLYVQPFSNLVEGIYANGHGWTPAA